MSAFANLFTKAVQAQSATTIYEFVAALDISGSMRAGDGIDRSKFRKGVHFLQQTPCTRIEAAKADIKYHYKQLKVGDRLDKFTLLLFGERLHVLTPKSEEELESALDAVKLEGSTRTDLAIAESNRLFLEHQKKCESTGRNVTFVTVVYTDGAPYVPGKNDMESKEIVANLLAEGTMPMKNDEDRATTFIQYGTSEYGDNSPARQFLCFLDNNLDELTKTLYLKNHPGVNPDSNFTLYDACDTGQQCQPWGDKNPKRKDRESAVPWDNNIDDIVDEATSD